MNLQHSNLPELDAPSSVQLPVWRQDGDFLPFAYFSPRPVTFGLIVQHIPTGEIFRIASEGNEASIARFAAKLAGPKATEFGLTP